MTLFDKFVSEMKDKSFNEILGCAKINALNLSLLLDVDDYNNNEIKCLVSYYNDNKVGTCEVSIKVEVGYNGNEVTFNLIKTKEQVVKYGRTWEVIDTFDNTDGNYWKVMNYTDGELWMNNYEGAIVFVETNGKLLFDYI